MPERTGALRTGAVERMRAGAAAPYGWAPLVAMVLVTLVDRIETSVVAGVLPILQDEWGFGDTAGGAIPGAVGVAGLLITLPAGLLADRVDRVRLVAWVVGSWSLIITGSALATGFGMFFATRIVLGGADSLDGPSVASLLSDWYPPHARARVYGLHRMATFAGAPLGALLGGVIGELVGWRAVFLCMVVPGMIVAWLVHRLPEPRRGEVDRVSARNGLAVTPATSRDGDAPDPTGGPAPAPSAVPVGDVALPRTNLWGQLRTLFRIPTVARVYVGLLVLFLGLSGVAFWLPSFYERTYDLGEGAAAATAAGIGLVGVGVGAVVGGVLGDRHHGAIPGFRILIGGGGQLAGAAAGAASFLTEPVVLQVPLITLALVFLGLGIPNLSAAIADVLPSRRRGIGFALLNFMVAIGGAAGPFLVGGLSDATGSLRIALALLAIPMVVGGASVLRARGTYEGDARAVVEAAGREADDS